MDIWSRIIGGGASPAKRSSEPQQRLLRFKKVHDQLQLTSRRLNTLSPTLTPETILPILRNINTLLQNELQAPTPHLCARHVSTFHIHSTIAQLASTNPTNDVIHETLEVFKSLLESEEGEFAKNKSFADALVGFVGAFSGGTGLDAGTEVKVAEVLFGVAAKIRAEKEVMESWFRPSKRSWALPTEHQQPKADREEFPLFYLILDHVHHEGRTGDFARTGLLYLIEATGHDVKLEQWIIESDLATLMASGLGALYSQLSRKLVLANDDDALSSIVLLLETTRANTPHDADKTTSEEFKAHLSTFLSYLVFWQDVLEHCSSLDVKQSLLEHFKFLFLQQLLYPSLVESSDKDGGSSVAVLTYLKCIIESIDHPDLVRLTFEYLLALPEPKEEERTPSRPTTLARRRRSQSLLSTLAQEQQKPLPGLFNLDDLVLGSLGSNSQQTVTAALRLLSAMLRTHHQFDASLINLGQPIIAQTSRSMEVHERNTATLYAIIEDLGDNPSLGKEYEVQLEDAQNLLEGHACSTHLLALPADGGRSMHRSAVKASPGVASQDPVLNSLVVLLHNFLSNEVETNLSLTHTFSTIASCARRRLNGWFLRESFTDDDANSMDESAISDQDDTITLHTRAAEQANDSKGNVRDGDDAYNTSTTPVFAAFDLLVLQVERFRREIQDFDQHLAERRQVLKAAEDVTKARRASVDSTILMPPPKRVEKARIGSISERLLSNPSTAAGSRATSPRGRRPESSTMPTSMVRRLSHLRHSPSQSPTPLGAPNIVRPISPSPLRNDLVSDGTPPEQSEPPVSPTTSILDPLQQKLRIEIHRYGGTKDISDIGSETSSMRSSSVMSDRVGKSDVYKDVSLNQLLTNIVILQEFVMELVAIVQVRATMFGEVGYGT